jgi:hypothetical protein
MKTEEKFNTELQRGLLKAHAEKALQEQKWLRFKSNDQRSQFVISPTNFLELLNQGRFEMTSPSMWELFTPEGSKVPEAPVTTTPTPAPKAPTATPTPIQKRTPMRNNGATAGRKINYYGNTTTPATRTTTTTPKGNLPEDEMWMLMQRRKALAAERARVEAEYAQTTTRIQQLAQQLDNADVPTRPTNTTITPPASKPTNGRKRRKSPRFIAKGIRTAILQEIVDHGPLTVGQFYQRLVPKFHQDKVNRNLYSMLQDNVLQQDANKRYALGERWANARSARRVERTEAVTE